MLDATRCTILRLKCIKFDFRSGSAPNTAGGAYSALQTLAVFKGPTSKERRGKWHGRRGIGKGKGREGKNDFTQIPGYATAAAKE